MNTKTIISLCIAATLALSGCKSDKKQEESMPILEVETTEVSTPKAPEIDIQPVSHGTMVLNWNNITIYVDPVGGAEAFNEYEKPQIILVTDIHGDHLNVETLSAISTEQTTLIAPKAVVDKLPENLLAQIQVLNNGEIYDYKYLQLEAIPMYNLREEALKFHEKGRGNGYVLQMGDQRVYISGDTEDIPEMRALENIDIAFVCMNLPYTMTPESAADAVIEFGPKKVYPFHYRGTEGLSDVAKFKELVEAGNPEVTVVQLDWYPQS